MKNVCKSINNNQIVHRIRVYPSSMCAQIISYNFNKKKFVKSKSTEELKRLYDYLSVPFKDEKALEKAIQQFKTYFDTFYDK